MIKKLKFIIKFFINNEEGKLRKDNLLPILGTLIGSFIIFMTLSIMNGMQTEIINRIDSFNYKYYTKSDDAKYSEIIFDNVGYEKTCVISKNSKDNIVILKSFKNVEHFLNNKIKNYLIKDNKYNNSIIIGSQLANDLYVNVGDSVLLSSPVDINIVTKRYPAKKFIVSDIFNTNLFDYDSRFVIASYSAVKDVIMPNQIDYFSDKLLESIDLKTNNNQLIYALMVEKKVYIIIGFFIVFISSLMLFNVTILSLFQKQNQLKVLELLSMSKNNIFLILFIKNLIFSISCVFIAFLVTELCIFLNFKYDLLMLIFNALPYDIIPFNFNYSEYLRISLLLVLLNSFIGTSPMFFIKYNWNN